MRLIAKASACVFVNVPLKRQTLISLRMIILRLDLFFYIGQLRPVTKTGDGSDYPRKPGQQRYNEILPSHRRNFRGIYATLYFFRRRLDFVFTPRALRKSLPMVLRSDEVRRDILSDVLKQFPLMSNSFIRPLGQPLSFFRLRKENIVERFHPLFNIVQHLD